MPEQGGKKEIKEQVSLQMTENTLKRESLNIWGFALVALETILSITQACAECFSIPRGCIILPE